MGKYSNKLEDILRLGSGKRRESLRVSFLLKVEGSRAGQEKAPEVLCVQADGTAVDDRARWRVDGV